MPETPKPTVTAAELEPYIQSMKAQGKSFQEIVAFADNFTIADEPSQTAPVKKPTDWRQVPSEIAKGLVSGGFETVTAVPKLLVGAVGDLANVENPWGPVAVGPQLVNASAQNLAQAQEQYQKGNYGRAALRLAAATPVIGPTVDTLAQELGSGDPYQMAHAVGSVGGAFLLPRAIKPSAVRLGTAMQEMGKKGELPLRMAGGAAVLGGHPIKGVTTMAMPSILKATGTRLQRWGKGVPVTAEERAIAGTLGASGSELPPPPPGGGGPGSPSEGGPAMGRSDLWDTALREAATRRADIPQTLPELNQAILEDARAGGSPRLAKMRTLRVELERIDRALERSRTAEERATLNQERLDLIREARGDTPENKPSFRRSVSAQGPEGTETMRVRYGKSEAQQQLEALERRAAEAAARRQPPVEAPFKISPEKNPEAYRAIMEEVARQNAPSPAPPGGPAAPIPAEMPKIVVKEPGTPPAPTGPRPPKVPVEAIETKSKRGVRSVDINALTEADVQFLKDQFKIDPTKGRITRLSQAMTDALLKDRAERAAAHRLNAGLDAGARRAMERGE